MERTYNVPLRREFQKVPRYKRAKRAVTALREFISKHMKSDKVKLGEYVNREIWKRGIKNPPHHVKVTAVKDEEGVVTVELVGAPKKRAKEKKIKTKLISKKEEAPEGVEEKIEKEEVKPKEEPKKE
ncbi:hypothetical protein DRJ48_02660 [Candidatus Woesearchaeota archaeon]|nr:MAG: hypothetical protein DRJ48_02660 [Candidatus Woesearchaeota archaeon]